MSFIKPHDQEAYEQLGPSVFLFEKLNAFVELYSFLELTTETVENIPHVGFRIVLNNKANADKAVHDTLNSFSEFFINRVLPYLHYYQNRGEDILKPIDELVLVIVYFDFVAKYKVDLEAMNRHSPVNLDIYTDNTLNFIRQTGNLLGLDVMISEICFNEPTFDRGYITKEMLRNGREV